MTFLKLILEIRTSGFANRINTNPSRLRINWISRHLKTRTDYRVFFVFLVNEIKLYFQTFTINFDPQMSKRESTKKPVNPQTSKILFQGIYLGSHVNNNNSKVKTSKKFEKLSKS